MAAVSEPASPPAAKRARIDPDTQFSTLPPSPQPNGHSEGNGATSSTSHAPTITSAPLLPDPEAGKKEKNEDYESDEEDVPEQPVAEEEDLSRADMYLDTVSWIHLVASRSKLMRKIARSKLDFDFERLCSKSLSNINVYACLVCGKYFQGRGRGSWAYRHAVGDNHRVWLNLSTEKVRVILPFGGSADDPVLRFTRGLSGLGPVTQ